MTSHPAGAAPGRTAAGRQVPGQRQGQQAAAAGQAGDAPAPAGSVQAAPASARELAGTGGSGRPAPPARLPGDEHWALLGYLAVPLLSFIVPLAIYAGKRHQSAFLRQQAAQALSLAVSWLIYSFCVLLVGLLLTLDSVGTAVLLALPLALLVWALSLGYLIRAAFAARHGEYYQVPGWICATIAR